MIKLRIFGDLHGERKLYLESIQGAEYSIQLGDFDSEYHWLTEANVDPSHHVFIGGNHDNYNLIEKSPHCLGDFGVFDVPGVGNIFFMRGARSIDYKVRSIDEREELNIQRIQAAIELYNQVKPQIVVSHDCPLKIVPYVSSPLTMHQAGHKETNLQSKTCHTLQAMTDIHRPKLHLFGHHHISWKKWVDGRTGITSDDHKDKTLYVCVGVMKGVDLIEGILETLV